MSGFYGTTPEQRRQHAPTAYPCYGYAVMADWRLGEEVPEFLYLSDVDEMHRTLLEHSTEVE